MSEEKKHDEHGHGDTHGSHDVSAHHEEPVHGHADNQGHTDAHKSDDHKAADHGHAEEKPSASKPPSELTQALVKIYSDKATETPEGEGKILVSRTVSAAAFLMEKIRNSVEFRDDHVIRRAAIERIIRRRLFLNSSGEGVGKYLIRELMWAKYIPSGSLTEENVETVQSTLDKFFKLRQGIASHNAHTEKISYADWIIEVVSCAIEEQLSPPIRDDAFVNYMYQQLVNTILVDGSDGEDRDIQVYIAVNRVFGKTDVEQLRYKLLRLYLPEIDDPNYDGASLLPRITSVIKAIEEQINHRVGNKMFLYMRRQVAPFRILKDLFDAKDGAIGGIVGNVDKLKESVWQMCGQRYTETAQKLRRMAVRSIIYLFITKMFFALLIEVPADRILEGKVDVVPLAINIIFPPILMFIITLAASPPGENNTKRIYSRIAELVTTMPQEKKKKLVFNSQTASMKPLQTFMFTIFYGIAFLLSFGGMAFILHQIGFSVVSQLIFLFFISMITFFGYRTRMTAQEYQYQEREGVLTPLFDIFVLPVLEVGRLLSSGVAKLNVFTYIFDFLLEMPFKGILEILEEWFSFIRAKKEEIA